MPGVQIFSDLKFFVLQRVPSRTRWSEDIERHGGRVVKLETQADYIIADDLRKDAPKGSVSWRFIETAAKTGALPDVSQFRIGGTSTATQRPAGGLSAPGISTRTPFTAEDDCTLYTFVKRCEARGCSVKGNEIYKDLERLNPRHTYQSWRARYIKQLSVRPPAGIEECTLTATPPPARPEMTNTRQQGSDNRGLPSPQTSTHADEGLQKAPAVAGAVFRPPGFKQKDVENLLDNAESIEDIPFKSWEKAWATWADLYGRHTWKEWAAFYTQYVRPEYEKQRLQRQQSQGNKRQFAASAGPQSYDQVDGAISSRVAREESPEEQAPSQARRLTSASPRTQYNVPTRVPALSSVPALQRSAAQGRPQHSKRRRIEIPQRVVSSEPPNVERLTGQTAMSGVMNVARFERAEKQHDAPPSQSLSAAQPTNSTYIGRAASQSRPLQTGTQDRRQSTSKTPALTEQNLARMQAEHRQSGQKRAVDLPVDDDDRDQSDYANYLGDILRAPSEVPGPFIEQHDVKLQVEEIPESEVGVQLGHRSPSAVSSKELGSSPEFHAQSAHDKMRHTLAEEHEASGRSVVHTKDTRSKTVPIARASRPSLQSRAPVGRNAFANGISYHQSSDLPSSPPVPPNPGRMSRKALEEDAITEPPVLLEYSEPEGGFFAQFSSSYSSDHAIQSVEQAQEEDLDHEERNVSMKEAEAEAEVEVEEEEDSLQQVTPRAANFPLETQAIFDAETQEMDLTLPDFYEDDIQSIRSSHRDSRRVSSYLRDTSRSVTPIPSDGEDYEPYIEEKIKEGHKEEHVLDALHATCMQVGLAQVALDFLSRGKRLPRSVSGIWTAEEDEALNGGDGAKLKALEKKHGSREYKRRVLYLQELQG